MTSGLLTVPFVAILLVAGCAAQNPSLSESPVSPSSSESAQPAVTAGASVDAATAQKLNSDPKGQYRGYAMPDGSNIVIDRAAPLPEPVQRDVNAKGEAVAQQYTDVLDSLSPAAGRARGEVMKQVMDGTGKKVILVIRESGFDYNENPVTGYYPMGSGIRADGTTRDKSAMASYIDAFLAGKNANDYVVIWPN